MKIEFAVKSLQSFIRDVRKEARAVSNNKTPRDEPQEGAMRLYFRNQNEVNEAYASAWVHRYHPRAFNLFRGFDTSSIDPLHSVGEGNLARQAGGQLPRIEGAPWDLIAGGADVRGTIGIGESGDGTIAIMPIGMTQPMTHLAFLAAWESGDLGMVAPEVQFNPPAVKLRTHLEIKKPNRVQVIEFSFPAYLSSDSNSIMERVETSLNNDAPLVIVSPSTFESHHYFATESMFDIATLLKLGVVTQQFTGAKRIPMVAHNGTTMPATKHKLRMGQSPSWGSGMHFQSSIIGQSKTTTQERVA